MKCRCGHEEEKHYGSEDKQCNAISCECAGFVAAALKAIPAEVVKEEELVPVKRGPGRPRK